MVLKGEGSIQSVNGKTWIYISKSVVEDSAFPFKKRDKVVIEIKDEKLIISLLMKEGK